MTRLVLFSLTLLLASLSSLSIAFDDPNLAVLASQYHQGLLDRYASAEPDPRSDALRQAMRYARQGLWKEAIEQYEKMIAGGENQNFAWLRLSEAWQGDENQSKRNDHRQRALQAAYNAYVSAQADSGRARALFILGDLYEQTEQPKLAMAAWKEALGLEENPDIAGRYQKLVEAHAFRVTGVEVESNSATPKLCLNFSDNIQRAKNIHYEDYLQIEPAIEMAVNAQDKRLCVEGASHGEEYQITLRPGITSESGEKLENPEVFTVAVADREPTLGFRGSAYILPKTGEQGVPLTSVNVSKVAIQVLQVNDRNLVRELDDSNIFRTLDGYSASRIVEHTGAAVWQGEMAIDNQLNQEITTALPMQEVLQRTEPGIYVITASDPDQDQERWRDLATQWLIVSDLGISTFQGEDGLHVFLRSLENGQPLSNIKLRLFARNNSELSSVTTDEQGYAGFDPGLLRGSDGLVPSVLMAYGANGDFNFIDLTRPGFDLSDRGVGGRSAPGPVDVFLYSERGVYRPGETVHLMALLRNDQGYALSDNNTLPLTLKLIRPDEVVADEFALTQSELGGYYTNLSLSDNARSGSWQVQAYTDPKAKPVGQLRFQVEDFVPQRLKLALESDATALLPGNPVDVAVTGRFLYGAPAAGLNTEAELVLREDADPYPGYPGYQFGLAQESWTAKRYPLTMAGTDDKGLAEVAMQLDEIPDVSRPLQAVLRVSLFEPGGRPVNQILTLPYRMQPFSIGIKPNFKDAVEMGQEAGFEGSALDSEGKPLGIGGLQYQL
jgi:uncharacterized protein YfaS (alpha-2-macroglobulin family)